MTATGGIVTYEQLLCPKHGEPLVPAHVYMGPTVMTCPICNAELVDEMHKRAGAVTVEVRK